MGKKDEVKKGEVKKEEVKKVENKRGSKKEENVNDIDLESKEQVETVTAVKDEKDEKDEKNEKNEKKKRGRNTTPKKGKGPNTDTVPEVKEELVKKLQKYLKLLTPH